MKERGMMKWISYKSLSEQEKYLNETLDRKQAVDKPLISNEKAEKINEILCTYVGEEVALLFYASGHIKESRGTIKIIDGIYKFVEMNDIRIPFSNIVNLERL